MNGKRLYRDMSQGRVGGVCAGIAAYTGMELWLVRILTVSAFLLGGGFMIVLLYLAGCLILDKMPEEDRMAYRSTSHHQVKQKAWQSGQSATALLQTLERELGEQDRQIQAMEAYVTSSRFHVDREFSKL
ncbi:envelope stress response membrane protein PspC [Thaumasiovibrio sp. DFM-14]|uniref:envelope stress response membrane protein PspC n=1 Tax=Thaumasiovibrio sp. DFM-14 TaxID=3384792 RepID=UPI0039A258AE